MQHFPNLWLMQIYFTSGIGPDILMKVFKGYIVFPIWETWVLLIFILNTNKGFRSRVLLKMSLFLS